MRPRPLRSSAVALVVALAASVVCACGAPPPAPLDEDVSTRAIAGGTSWDGPPGGGDDDPGGAGGARPVGAGGSPATTTTTTPAGAGGSAPPAPAPGGEGGAPPDPAPKPPACQYPSGPYGVSIGDVVPPNLSWTVLPEDSGAPRAMGPADFFDCDGSRGIRALHVTQSATWCGACQQQAEEVEGSVEAWKQQGIHVLELMFEDVSGNPATVATAQQWKKKFGLTCGVGADPGFSFQPGGSVGLPYNLLVDPRTMKVVDIEEGYSGDYSALIALAQKNH